MELSGVKGLIIDLRDNPGGLVDVCIEIADSLLPEGIITYTEDRQGQRNYYKSDPGATEIPFVVMINGGSASASEIVAGAVKDSGVGKIVGYHFLWERYYSGNCGVEQRRRHKADGDAILLSQRKCDP
jgi:carboxyl-terminal processing protease